jgi:hypothetical protein
MEVSFSVLDGREKRWFPKVAQAAKQSVNQIIGSIKNAQRLEFHAQFDTKNADQVNVVECKEGKMCYTVLVFAAGGWQTVAHAIPNATSQLASAVLISLSNPLRSEAENRFTASGILVSPAQLGKKTIQTDGLTDFYLYLDTPTGRDAFFSLIEQIDSALQKASLGEVSGNAYGLVEIKSCIDIVSADPKNAKRIVESVLKENGIQTYTFKAQQRAAGYSVNLGGSPQP